MLRAYTPSLLNYYWKIGLPLCIPPGVLATAPIFLLWIKGVGLW